MLEHLRVICCRPEHDLNVMEQAKVRNKVRVIVGGGPIDDRFEKDVRSDGKDAIEAVWIYRELIARS